MIRRLRRIHHEFGRLVLAKMILLLAGMVGMSLAGIIAFESWWPTVIVIVGLALSYFLRKQIVEIFEWTTWAIPGVLFIYGVVLFIGERLGSREIQLIIITIATVLVFALQFWAFSDPSIVKIEDDE